LKQFSEKRITEIFTATMMLYIGVPDFVFLKKAEYMLRILIGSGLKFGVDKNVTA